MCEWWDGVGPEIQRMKKNISHTNGVRQARTYYDSITWLKN